MDHALSRIESVGFVTRFHVVYPFLRDRAQVPLTGAASALAQAQTINYACVDMIPSPAFFQHFFEYVKWADRRQLDAARALPAEALTVDRGMSMGSIMKMFLHLVGAQSVWLDRFEGRPVKVPWNDATSYTFAQLEEFINATHERVTSFFAAQTPASLEAVIQYKNLRGDDFAFPLWSLMLHVCNHSTYHRGQINSMIKQAGGTPVGTDYSTYINETKVK